MIIFNALNLVGGPSRAEGEQSDLVASPNITCKHVSKFTGEWQSISEYADMFAQTIMAVHENFLWQQ